MIQNKQNISPEFEADKRQSVRWKTSQSVQIIHDYQKHPIDGLVVNRSAGGARIATAGLTTAPPVFTLLDPQTNTKLTCQTVWQRHNEIGVKFIEGVADSGAATLQRESRFYGQTEETINDETVVVDLSLGQKDIVILLPDAPDLSARTTASIHPDRIFEMYHAVRYADIHMFLNMSGNTDNIQIISKRLHEKSIVDASETIKRIHNIGSTQLKISGCIRFYTCRRIKKTMEDQLQTLFARNRLHIEKINPHITTMREQSFLRECLEEGLL